MIDVEPLIRAELAARREDVRATDARWRDVLARSGELKRRRRRRVGALAAAAIVAGVLASGPIGAAVSRVATGFSAWLADVPGTSAPREAQKRFDARGRFPGHPRLRELLRTSLSGETFVLYGFETKGVVCLRLIADPPRGSGPQTACVSRRDLQRSGDLVLPVKANVTVGHIGRLPRRSGDPPAFPRFVVTFGLAAAEVEHVTVRFDGGASPALVANGSFLHVFAPGRRVGWAWSIVARAHRVTAVVPLSVQNANEPPLHSRLHPRGPARVERVVRGGTIGWFVRREPRGIAPADAPVPVKPAPPGFARVLLADPADFLELVVSDRPQMPFPGLPHLRAGQHRLCYGVVTVGGSGGGCVALEDVFRDRPTILSWQFSGIGQQLWLVSGLVSDDVARLEVFPATGPRWRAPLRDNATVFRVQRAKFPIRVVAYDGASRVIDVQTIRGG